MVAPAVQLVSPKPSDVGTLVRISVQSQELGFFLTKKIKNDQQVENDYFVMGTKNLTENGRNPFFLFGTLKNMVRVNLMATVFEENSERA